LIRSHAYNRATAIPRQIAGRWFVGIIALSFLSDTSKSALAYAGINAEVIMERYAEVIMERYAEVKGTYRENRKGTYREVRLK
jgi:hypothetical protein